MSYDLYIEVDAGGPEPIDVSDYWNYTSNCSGMWRKAMPETDGLAGMDGMKAADAAVVLEKGIAAMEADPDAYRAMNPENGWGSFDSQLEALKDWLRELQNAPNGRMRVSR